MKKTRLKWILVNYFLPTVLGILCYFLGIISGDIVSKTFFEESESWKWFFAFIFVAIYGFCSLCLLIRILCK
jgi:hypothetical protein